MNYVMEFPALKGSAIHLAVLMFPNNWLAKFMHGRELLIKWIICSAKREKYQEFVRVELKAWNNGPHEQRAYGERICAENVSYCTHMLAITKIASVCRRLPYEAKRWVDKNRIFAMLEFLLSVFLRLLFVVGGFLFLTQQFLHNF